MQMLLTIEYNVNDFSKHIHRLFDDPKRYIMFYRICKMCVEIKNNLKNIYYILFLTSISIS